MSQLLCINAENQSQPPYVQEGRPYTAIKKVSEPEGDAYQLEEFQDPEHDLLFFASRFMVVTDDDELGVYEHKTNKTVSI